MRGETSVNGTTSRRWGRFSGSVDSHSSTSSGGGDGCIPSSRPALSSVMWLCIRSCARGRTDRGPGTTSRTCKRSSAAVLSANWEGEQTDCVPPVHASGAMCRTRRMPSHMFRRRTFRRASLARRSQCSSDPYRSFSMGLSTVGRGGRARGGGHRGGVERTLHPPIQRFQ